MTKLKEHLQSLETLDLVALKKSRPDSEYAFKHIFTQQSVYQSLSHTNRRQLHQQVGEALETIYAAELDDIALLLAHHFEQSDDKERALKYLKIAAEQAQAAYANQEAKELYSRALALLDKHDYAGRLDLLAGREQILDRLGERRQQAADLTLMQILAELMIDNWASLAIAHNRRAAYFDKIGEYQTAAKAAQTGLHVARRSGKAQLEAQSLNLLALAAWRRFDYAAVKKWASEALEVLKLAGEPAAKITCLLHLARASCRLGQYDAALDYAQAGQKLANYTDNQNSHALADLILGWIQQHLGDYDLAEKHFQAAFQIRCLIGDRHGQATALGRLGCLACDQQKYEDGLPYCREALEISQAIGDRENEAYALSGIGLIYENMGDLETAVSTYRQALTIHHEIGAANLAVSDQAGLARIALARQNFETAREHIAAVTDWILAGKAQQCWRPWTIYQSAYEVLTTLDETDTAAAILDEAHLILHQRAQEISEPELRRSFLEKVAVNREIEQTWQDIHGSD